MFWEVVKFVLGIWTQFIWIKYTGRPNQYDQYINGLGKQIQYYNLIDVRLAIVV